MGKVEKEKQERCGDESMFLDHRNRTYALACHLPKGHEGEHRDCWYCITWFTDQRPEDS